MCDIKLNIKGMYIIFYSLLYYIVLMKNQQIKNKKVWI